MILTRLTVALCLVPLISVHGIFRPTKASAPPTVAAVDAPPNTDMKVQVVEGTDIESENYKWFTQILVEVDADQDGDLERRFICSGTLIAEDYVLTAAHCVTNETGQIRDILWGVNVGYMCEDDDNCGRESKQIPGKAFLPHPAWRPPALLNDIALIQLETPIDFIKPAKPDDGSNYWWIWPFLDLTVVGGGTIDDNRTLPSVVQEKELNYIPTRWCESWLSLPEFFFSDDVVCTFADWLQGGTCNGDSGGALILPTSRTGMEHDLVVGVTSFGLQLPWKPCTLKFAPDVFARVSNGYPWIEAIVCYQSSNPPSWCGEEETLIPPETIPENPVTPVSSPVTTTGAPTSTPTTKPSLRPTTTSPTFTPTAAPTDMVCQEEKDFTFVLDEVALPGESRSCEWLSEAPAQDRRTKLCNSVLSTASVNCPLTCSGCDPSQNEDCKGELSASGFIVDVESDLTHRKCKWLVKEVNRDVEFCSQETSNAATVCACTCAVVQDENNQQLSFLP